MKHIYLSIIFILFCFPLSAQNDAASSDGKYMSLIKEVKVNGKGFKEFRKQYDSQYDLGLMEEQTINGEYLPKGYWIFVQNDLPQIGQKTEKGVRLSVGVGTLLQTGKAILGNPKLYIWKEENPNYVPQVASNSTSAFGGGGFSSKMLTTQIKDERDNRTYSTVLIGNKRWFAENLKFQPVGFSNTEQNRTPLSLDRNVSSFTYRANDSYFEKYGVLYKNPKNELCPKGWHVSTEKDWKALEAYFGYSVPAEFITANSDNDYGDTDTRGKFVKVSTGKTEGMRTMYEEKQVNLGDQIKNSPFNFTMGGAFAFGDFKGENESEHYWVMDNGGTFPEYARWLRSSEPGVGREYMITNPTRYIAYCRCVEDNTNVAQIKAEAKQSTATTSTNSAQSNTGKVAAQSSSYQVWIASEGIYYDVAQAKGVTPPRIQGIIQLAPSTTKEYVFQKLKIDFLYDTFQGYAVNIAADGRGKSTFPMRFDLGVGEKANIEGFSFNWAGGGSIFSISSDGNNKTGFLVFESYDPVNKTVSGYYEFTSKNPSTTEKAKGTFKNVRLKEVEY